jgi:hypothetical protein
MCNTSRFCLRGAEGELGAAFPTIPTHVRHDEKELPTLGVEVGTNGAEETATGPLVPSIALPSPSNKLGGTRRLGLRANLPGGKRRVGMTRMLAFFEKVNLTVNDCDSSHTSPRLERLFHFTQDFGDRLSTSIISGSICTAYP